MGALHALSPQHYLLMGGHQSLYFYKGETALPEVRVGTGYRLYGDSLPFSTVFGPFWGVINAIVTHIGFKISV